MIGDAMLNARDVTPLLDVANLRVGYRTPRGEVEAVRGVSFSLGREKLAIVGESGSGKSTIGRAILRVLPSRTRIEANRMRFGETDLLTAGNADMRRIRGRGIAMITQDPKFSLNPLLKVGEQIAETYRVHHQVARGEAVRRALDMMEKVRIRDPARVFHFHPHQLSGGMGQRIMIAMMLIAEPALLIADEPTSALDVSIRAQILTLLDELIARNGLALMLITHDLNLAATFCDRILVMYRGCFVESLASHDLAQARHPYTRGLLAAMPRLGQWRVPLPVINRASLTEAAQT